MADAAAADCVGNDPLRVQRDAAPSTIASRNKTTSSTSHSQSTSPSSTLSHRRRLDCDDNPDDAASVASSTGTAGRKGKASPSSHPKPKAKFKSKDKDKGPGSRPSQQQQQQQSTESDQQLRKSASASTTASARTNTSTEVRAAVSNRASRSALTRQSVSPTSSPATSFSSWHDIDAADSYPHHPQHHHSSHAQGIGISYPAQGQGLAPSAAESASASRFNHPQTGPGIIQVNPAPPPSPLPLVQTRGRPQMASSIIPSFFGRRRPTSSASSVHSSNFAAANPPPPGPAAFDFNSILNSLDSDTAAQADIDAIAEICGRSRLSLANAHANHRGPVGELVGSDVSGSAGMLETVREGGTPGREEERRLGGSRAGSAAGDDRWHGTRTAEAYDEEDSTRQSPRGAVSGVIAYGSSVRTEDEGRARRHLMRVRDVSNEREQRRQRR